MSQEDPFNPHGIHVGPYPLPPRNAPWDEGSLLLLLGRMEGKLDAVLDRLSRQEVRQDHVEEKVQELERGRTRDRAYTAGLATAFTTLIHWFRDYWL